MDPILRTHRPDPRLLKVYLVRSLLTGPLLPITLPLLYFRYRTLRYTFDGEGISMRWGVLFRREVNLTYSRIQDIHLTSGPLLRWLGLADIHIQTAAGSASAEMKVEGLPEFEAIREFLYSRMRGHGQPEGAPTAGNAVAPTPALVQALGEVRDELRAARRALEGTSGSRRETPP